MRLFLILLIFTICSGRSVAQCNTLVSSATDSQYVIEKTEASNFFFICNKENRLKKIFSNINYTFPDFFDFNSANTQLRNITKSVLGESFGRSKRDMLIVFFCINSAGQILEIEYGVNSPTKIPLSKLGSLECLLKEKLIFNNKRDSLNSSSQFRFGMATTIIRSKKIGTLYK